MCMDEYLLHWLESVIQRVAWDVRSVRPHNARIHLNMVPPLVVQLLSPSPPQPIIKRGSFGISQFGVAQMSSLWANVKFLADSFLTSATAAADIPNVINATEMMITQIQVDYVTRAMHLMNAYNEPNEMSYDLFQFKWLEEVLHEALDQIRRRRSEAANTARNDATNTNRGRLLRLDFNYLHSQVTAILERLKQRVSPYSK